MNYNICFFSDDYLPSKTGVGVSIAMQAGILARQGHQVVVLTSRRPEQPEHEYIDGVSIYRLWSLPVFGFYQAFAWPGEIRRILLKHKIQIAHFHYLSLLSLLGSQVARSLGIRLVYTHHMTVDHLTQPLPMRPLRPLLSRLIRRFTSRMDMTTSPSRNFVLSHEEDSSVPLRFLSNPLPFSPSGFDGVPTKKEHDDSGRFTVLFVGRLDPEKNVSFLIRSFARAVQLRPELHLKIAGLGSQAQLLRDLAERLGVSEKVEFLGWVDRNNLAKVYASADAFVLPSLVETQGLVALEAMMFSKAVVVADSIITATELVTPGENGFIVKANDEMDLASVLVQLAANPQATRAMGIRARIHALSMDFSLEQVTDQLLALYSEVCQAPIQKPAPRGQQPSPHDSKESST